MLTLEYASLFKGSIHSQAETTNVNSESMPAYLKEAYIVRRRPRMLNSESMPAYLKEAYIVRRRPRMLNSGVCQPI